jgi:hypothetical protein
MKNLDTLNKEEHKYILKPLAIALVIFIFIVLIFTIGIKKLNLVVANNAAQSELNSNLSKKVSVLKKVNTVIAENTTFLDIVLPNKTAALYGLNIVKYNAIENNLIISNLKTSSASKVNDSISRTIISMELTGTEEDIYKFIDSFKKTLPLMKIDKFRLSDSDDLANANVSLSVYSSELPKVIPAVSTSVDGLTSSETKLLLELETYKLPLFVEPKAQVEQVKEDPFSQ